jgi:hypothetical protein
VSEFIIGQKTIPSQFTNFFAGLAARVFLWTGLDECAQALLTGKTKGANHAPFADILLRWDLLKSFNGRTDQIDFFL